MKLEPGDAAFLLQVRFQIFCCINFFLDQGILDLCQYKNESILQIHGVYYEELDCSS